MFKKTSILALSSAIMALSVAGCGSGGDKNPAAAPAVKETISQEPITLKAYAYSGSFNKQDFDKYIVPPLKAKYPNITLEYIANGKGTSPQELAVAGEMPDIIMTGMRQLLLFMDLDAVADVRELSKKNNLDASLYRKEIVDAIASYGNKGEVYALPFNVNFYAMLYNKDIFDKFGMEYPKDSMSWDEVRALAVKLTKEVDGVMYRGMQPGDVTDVFGAGLSLPYVDGSGNAKLTTDDWKYTFELAKSFNSIPGNEPKNPVELWRGADEFFKDKNVAMLPYFGTRLQKAAQMNDELGFKWDVVTFPSHKQSPGKSAEVDGQVFALSKTSKHPNEAFAVLQYLTASKEVQIQIAQMGRALPALKDDSLMKVFGAEYPVLQQKNLQGIFKSTLSPAHKASTNDEIARKWLGRKFAEYLSGKLDVNTALMQAEEEANKEIQSLKKK